MPRKDIAGTDKGSQMQGWTPPSFPKPFHLKCNALGRDLGSVVRLDLNDGASEEITIGAAGLGPALQYNKLGGVTPQCSTMQWQTSGICAVGVATNVMQWLML